MKSIIQTLIAITALATLGGTASAHSTCATSQGTCPAGKSTCSATGSRKVILDGKRVTVADCQYTRGLRSVRFFPVRK